MARPTEVKALAALLTKGGEGPEDLAKRAIELLDRLREDRVFYAAVTKFGEGLFGYGPYSTRNQAMTAATKGKIPMVAHTQNCAIVPVYSQRHAQKALEGNPE